MYSVGEKYIRNNVGLLFTVKPSKTTRFIAWVLHVLQEKILMVKLELHHNETNIQVNRIHKFHI